MAAGTAMDETRRGVWRAIDVESIRRDRRCECTAEGGADGWQTDGKRRFAELAWAVASAKSWVEIVKDRAYDLSWNISGNASPVLFCFCPAGCAGVGEGIDGGIGGDNFSCINK